ncbi:MAG: tetratricopeptide repeat protein [Candidatus Dojkabacteria bacterium]|jgi:tetratricopeptide (TPR) repeat protein
METTATTFDTEFIDDKIENQPYLNPFTQEALNEWFKANDSIKPIFEPREEWSKREAILEKDSSDENKQTLYLPKDLNLFEMIDVIKVVDEDTFTDNPEKAKQGSEKIENLAETFKKAGVYIDSNKSSLTEGEDIATELSRKFYNYGLSLELRTKKENEPIQQIVLSEGDKRELDKWLIGKERYYKVMGRLGPNPSQEDIRQERARHFRGYFKALSLVGSKGDGEKPWERGLGPVAKIHEATKSGIEREISQPDTEIYRTGLTRGIEKLKTGIKAPMTPKELWNISEDITGRDLTNERQRLYDKLEIPKLKKELEDIRREGNIEEIAEKEFKIAETIRTAINYGYQFEISANNPSEIIKDEYLNCLGSTLLGTSLLDDVGIKYLFVNPPGHVMTFLVTSNRKLYCQDFTPGGAHFNGHVMNGRFFKNNPDILALAENLDSFNVEFQGIYGYGLSLEYLGTNTVIFNISKSSNMLMVPLMNNIALSLSDIGKDKKAVEIYKKAIELNPKAFITYLNLTVSLYKLERYEEAIEVCKKAIELNPNDSLLYNNLGNTLFNLKRYEEAVEVYKKAVELNPDNSSLYKNLGNVLVILERYKEAAEVYKKAIELNPNDSLLYNNLSAALCELGQYEEAIEVCKKGIEINPNYSGLYKNLGAALFNLERYEEAVEMYNKAVELDPNDSLLYSNLGNVLVILERYEEAVEMFKKAIELNPNDSSLYKNLGNALYKLGQYEEATKMYKKGLDISPDDIMLKSALDNILKMSRKT